MRNWREVGGVSFDQHTVERNHLSRVPDRLRLGERDVACKRNQETHVLCAPRMLDAAGEAMQNATQTSGTPVLRNQRKAVVPCVLAVVGWTAMNNNGQLRCPRQLHLSHEDYLLYFSGRVVVKVVEADFSPRNHLGMPRPLEHLGISNVVRKVCFMRMNSYTRPDSRILRLAVVFFRQVYTAVGRVRSVTVSYGKVGFDPVLFRTRQHFVTIGVVAIAFEMGVGVDEHGRWSLVAGR